MQGARMQAGGRMGVTGRALALALVFALTAGAAPAPGPARIVSINSCVDAVLLRVADPRQIAAISHYSQDARATSVPLALARRFRATSGTAEEVVALAPDLVIAGGHVAPATIAALRRLRIPLVQIGVPASIAESNAQVAQIAALAGHRDRGTRLIAQTQAALARARGAGPPVSALIWQGGGLVPGQGTLADDLLRATGFRNLSAAYGLQQWDVLPLEYLVARPARVLLSAGAAAGEDRMLGHPVLRRLAARIAVRAYPARLLNCGGPTIIDAAARLGAIRRSL